MFPVFLAAHRRMIKRLVRIAEIVRFTMYRRSILTIVRTYARHTSHSVRSPRQQRVQLILRRRHFAQVLNAVVALIAIDVVYLPFWKTTLADSPDGMMQLNMNPFLVQTAVYA